MATSISVRTSGGAGPKEYKPIQCFNEILERPASLECHIARVQWLLIAEPEGLPTDLNWQVFSSTISQYVLASRGREESSGTFHPARFANTDEVVGGRQVIGKRASASKGVQRERQVNTPSRSKVVRAIGESAAEYTPAVER